MSRRWRMVRVGEGRIVFTAFWLLFLLLAAHALLETARDALFLASIPAQRLPFMYVAIALGSVVATMAGDLDGARRGLCGGFAFGLGGGVGARRRRHTSPFPPPDRHRIAFCSTE